jgi:hypothetical protein
VSKYKLTSLLCPSETVTEEQLATDRQLLAFDRTLAHLNRRGFLSVFAGAAAMTALAGGRSAFAQTTTTVSVTDVLNFALNLEYLEANFYLYVSSGTGLSAADMGTGGVAVSGAPSQLPLDAPTMAVAKALAQDEKNHVELLRTAITSLNGTPISQPAINLAAMGAITTQSQFLAAARQFTALGGSAYAGSAQLLVSNASVLTTAAQILGAEGQHAGALNYLCATQGVTSPAIDAQDVPPSQTNYFTVAPMTALAPQRNTSQVLGVVYAVSNASTVTPTVGVTMGGFFPMGVNGNVKST